MLLRAPCSRIRGFPIALSSISYDSVEARYAVEEDMLAAIRRGDIAEATYQQNLFMGFSLDARAPDPLRDAKNMIIAVNTAYRKTIQQASVHPMYKHFDAIIIDFIDSMNMPGVLRLRAQSANSSGKRRNPVELISTRFGVRDAPNDVALSFLTISSGMGLSSLLRSRVSYADWYSISVSAAAMTSSAL